MRAILPPLFFLFAILISIGNGQSHAPLVRLDSVSMLETKLIDDLLDVIQSREEYLLLLNRPTPAESRQFIRATLGPLMQRMLREQLAGVLRDVDSDYARNIRPIVESTKRGELLEFAGHLMEALETGTLSIGDTKRMREDREMFTFFYRPEDREFRRAVHDLVRAFGGELMLDDVNDEPIDENDYVDENEDEDDVWEALEEVAKDLEQESRVLAAATATDTNDETTMTSETVTVTEPDENFMVVDDDDDEEEEGEDIKTIVARPPS